MDDFDRKDVNVLVWGEHCSLIKNIETLLDPPNKNNIQYFYCDRCTYWFNSKIKNDKHECSHSFKPEIVCPKKKHITFTIEHKRQNIKNKITADIECSVVEVSTKNNKYVLAEHISIAVGYKSNNIFKYFFVLDCIKDLLVIY